MRKIDWFMLGWSRGAPAVPRPVAGGRRRRYRGGNGHSAGGGHNRRTLADVPVGAHARVDKIGGNDAISLRLLEMGLTPGVAVSMIGTAPFGDPLEVELRGYRLSLRRSEAARVEIESS